MTFEEKSSLDVLVKGIVELVHPKRIILFGSAARGEMGPDSDIDVLVVMPDGTHRRNTEKLLYRNRPNIGYSIDFVVVTEEDIKYYAEKVGLVIRPALAEGIELYAA